LVRPYNALSLRLFIIHRSSFILMLYLLRQSLSSPWIELSRDLLQAPSRVTQGVEERIFQFRAGQISITLDNSAEDYTATTSSKRLSGTTEIAIADSLPVGNESEVLLWSGLVDPTDINQKKDERTVTVRVLQHGSGLNSQKAGLPDWPNSTDPGRRWRWTKTTDWWWIDQLADHFHNNNLGQAEVYFTPTAFDTIDDIVERYAFTKKFHYHSWNYRAIGISEQRDTEETGLSGDIYIATGHFRPYYHPDYTTDPATWPDVPLLNTPGSYLANPDSRHSLTSFAIPDIIADLIGQYNSTHPDHPLTYTPDPTVLAPLEVPTAVNILPETSAIRYVDLLEADGKLFVAVVWFDNQETVFPFTVYEIVNGSFLNPIIQDSFTMAIPGSLWDTRGPRWARAGGRPAHKIYFYQVDARIMGTVVRHVIEVDTITGEAVGVSDSFSDNPAAHSIDFTTGIGSQVLVAALEPDPVQHLHFGSASYTRRTNQLVYSGPILLDKVAFDYTDSSIAKILTDLAILTDSTFYVTPDRQFIFRSRRLPAADIKLVSGAVNRPMEITERDLSDEDTPTVSIGIQIADQHKRAIEDYYKNTRWLEQTTEATILAERDQLSALSIVRSTAATFNGTSSIITVPDHPSLALGYALTIAFWLRRAAHSGGIELVMTKGATFMVYLQATGTIRVDFYKAGPATLVSLTSTTQITDTNWHYFEFRMIYFGGGQGAQITIDENWNTVGIPIPGIPLVTADPIIIGGGTPSQYFNGDLVGIGLYNRALSTAEYTWHYNNGLGRFAPPDDDLRLGFHFDNRDNPLSDFSQYRHLGTGTDMTFFDSPVANNILSRKPRAGDRVNPAFGLPSLGLNALITETTLVGRHQLELKTRTAPTV
jgi:hypothetical protein